DTVGGDTNGDGAVSAPAAGDWYGINVGGGASKLGLNEVTMRYGSSLSAFEVGSVVVTSSRFVQGVLVDLGRNTGNLPLTFTGNTLSAVGAADSGLSVRAYDSTAGVINAAPVVRDNVVSGAVRWGTPDTRGGRAISLYGPNLDPAKFSGNTGSGNTQNALFLSGTLIGSATLPAAGLPWVIGDYYVQSLTVAKGVTLTLNAGAVLKAAPGSSLSVQGSLVAAGTAAAPVTFTS
ncbi:hypothetical protein, partial [Pedococcus aerophilus]|uniref:hypothetical protein n=1 Tax=Pedococcus aerophilus TaxID=436356 RepID=UPI0031DDF346